MFFWEDISANVTSHGIGNCNYAYTVKNKRLYFTQIALFLIHNLMNIRDA